MKINVSGAAHEEIVNSSGYGLDEIEPEVDKQVRAILEAAPAKRVGFGWQHPVELNEAQAESLADAAEDYAVSRDPAYGDFSHSTQRALFKLAADLKKALGREVIQE